MDKKPQGESKEEKESERLVLPGLAEDEASHAEQLEESHFLVGVERTDSSHLKKGEETNPGSSRIGGSEVKSKGQKKHGLLNSEKKPGIIAKGAAHGAQRDKKPDTYTVKDEKKLGATGKGQYDEIKVGNKKLGGTKHREKDGAKKQIVDGMMAATHVAKFVYTSKPMGYPRTKPKNENTPAKKSGAKKSAPNEKAAVRHENIRADITLETSGMKAYDTHNTGATIPLANEIEQHEMWETLSDSHLDIESLAIDSDEDDRATSVTVLGEIDEVKEESPREDTNPDESGMGDAEDEVENLVIHNFSSEEVVIILKDVNEQVQERRAIPFDHQDALKKVEQAYMRKKMKEGDKNPEELVVLYRNPDHMWPSREEQKKQEKIEKLQFRNDGCMFSWCLHQ